MEPDTDTESHRLEQLIKELDTELSQEEVTSQQVESGDKLQIDEDL